MAGHSKWAQIKRQKGVNDAKRGQLFTKLGNAISVAARGGGDPNMNPALAMAIEKAKNANMPSSNIERAIKRGTGELGGGPIEEYLFEGYGPGGVGILVEAASDNRNRTTSEVRNVFSKQGGHMAQSGAVKYLFKRKGLIRVKNVGDDELILSVIDAGAEDVVETGDELVIYTAMKDLGKVRDRLKEKEMDIIEATLVYEADMPVVVSDDAVRSKVERLIEALEELPDVTEVYTNFDIE